MQTAPAARGPGCRATRGGRSVTPGPSPQVQHKARESQRESPQLSDVHVREDYQLQSVQDVPKVSHVLTFLPLHSNTKAGHRAGAELKLCDFFFFLFCTEERSTRAISAQNVELVLIRSAWKSFLPAKSVSYLSALAASDKEVNVCDDPKYLP